MKSQTNYSDPNWVNISGGNPFRSVGKLPIPNDEKELRPHRPCCPEPRPPYKPPTENGYCISNGAKLNYYATFQLSYDNGLEKNVDVYIGQKIFVTFAQTGKSTAIYTIEGLLKTITPVPGSGFTITVDSSSEYNSSIYKIGSNCVLDIGKVKEESDKDDEIEENPDLDDANKVIEITEPVPPIPPRHDCGCKPPHGDFHDWMPPLAPPNPPAMSISWTNTDLEMVDSTVRNYKVMNIVYAKKAAVDTMLLIRDTSGKIVYKALDTSKKVSIRSNFVWTLRDYISYINEKVDLLDKLKKYTVDAAGNFVMTSGLVGFDENIDAIEHSNDTLSQSTRFFVDIIAGTDLLSYNPFETHRNGVTVITKQISITANILESAMYKAPTPEPVEPTPNPGENTDSEDDSSDGKKDEGTTPSAPSTGEDGNKENPSDKTTDAGGETGKDSSTETNPDTSDTKTPSESTGDTNNPSSTPEQSKNDQNTSGE